MTHDELEAKAIALSARLLDLREQGYHKEPADSVIMDSLTIDFLDFLQLILEATKNEVLAKDHAFALPYLHQLIGTIQCLGDLLANNVAMQIKKKSEMN